MEEVGAAEVTAGNNGLFPNGVFGVPVPANSNNNGTPEAVTLQQQEQPHYGSGQNPNTLASIAKHSFKPGQSGNPKGRPKGSQNRATVIKKLMRLKVPVTDPADPLKQKLITLYEAAALGQFKAAMNGSSKAWKEIQDTLFGPLPKEIKGDLNVNFSVLAKAAAQQLISGNSDDGSDGE